MEDSPHLYISEFGDGEDVEEEEEEDVYQEERDSSHNPHTHTQLDQETEKDLDCFLCKHCERRFTSKQGLERHMHTHALANDDTQTHNSNTGIISFGSILSEEQQEKANPLDPEGSVMQVDSSSSSGHSVLSAGELTAHPQQPGVLDGHHACKYCEKIFTTHTNKRRHERRVHENHLQPTHVDKNPKSREEDLQKVVNVSSQKTQLSDGTAPVAVLGNVVQHTEQYMLDVSSDISENLSFYIDGKIVSTSTVSNCEAVEVLSGSSALVGLDALILDPAQISHVLTTESATAKEIPGQPLAKRRTATPPLLPQIKTELESEVVVSSSSSSLVSSLIENLLPQNTESTVVQNERTVFLSPKLKQLLEKQDGLKPTLALITDSQKPCSPISLSVLPSGTGRFKRRTGSPQQNTSNEDASMADTGDFDGSTGQMETHHSSPVTQTVSENTSVSVSESTVKPVLTESWTPTTSGNSCNQQPLDLSNTVKRNDDVASADAALDLSLQRKSQDDPETLKSASRSDLNADATCALEQALVKIGEQSLSLMNPKAPLVTDFTIVTSSDIVTPVESLAEGLVYSLTLPPSSLTPSSPSLTPVALQPASPCTIAFASPASHAMLPSAPSLITVLAPPPPISSSLSQPIQVLAPNMSSEPLVICAENALNSSECDLTTTFAATNSANLVSLSQPLNPALNLPGHVFLTDPIALNPPIVESTSVSEVPFTPAVTLNESLLNSYNIASNTVLIECTIALEAPGRVVPAGITLQENPAEPPAPPQMLVNHVEQQQIVSVPNQQTVDPTLLVSSVEESVSLSTASAAISDSPAVAESSPEPKPVVDPEPPAVKVDEAADSSVPAPEVSSKTSPPPEKAEEEEEESTNNTTDDVEHQTFTKNFVCNVCDKLFHSMKELSHHVGDHADEWPYKCEFCLLLFGKPSALLDHRSNLHGVGKTYVCSACTKEFVYLCNLKQHQEELHPGQQCTHTEEEKGKLRPQNYNNSTKVESEPPVPDAQVEPKKTVKKEEGEVDVSAEELFTTIKIMASDGSKIKGPDVRLGINQHYPSFKPPPFPYHNRSPAGSVASATNFTTHNIPQTFSTAIRCTKCGKSFDNMPELHKHILACANASDKRRYTPRKNPIPLRHFAKTQNGVLSTTNSTNSINASNRVSQSNRAKPNQEAPVKFKVLNKRKKKLVQRVMPQRHKTVPPSNKASPPHLDEQNEIFICPHCSREFSMRRSRTKHMAVCPQKPTEAKKRKEGGISVTKENDGRLHRGVSRAEEKQQSSPPHKTRLQTSGSAKRPAVLPVQTLFSSKRSKIIIKESTQPKQDAATLNELPIVRTFNPAMRQYSRVQHGNKGAPIKFTVVKPQRAPQKDEFPPSHGREDGIGAVIGGTGQGATA
ncbi:PR domain zinc finger protein 2 [Salarias fasciatus]|nr:PR domain zinc finger protein 2-like [Salarias fasciatus]